jgi:UDP-N-acetylmuramyl pentapeptide phosphotransferase/UDP-N-acetylglucosamine-1-phosphate transferase
MSTAAASVAVVASLAAAAVGSVLTIALVRVPELLPGMVDEPNDRSLHTGSVPRTGGIAVLVAITLGWVVAWAGMGTQDPWAWVGLASLPVATVSLLDDRGGVRAGYRLLAHALGASILIAGGVTWSVVELPGVAIAPSPWLTYCLTAFFVIWMVNLYNFMDGMDGFAAGMTFFGFGTLSLLGWEAGDFAFAAVNGVIAGAGVAFLIGNFPPARIFLGDLGSATLGLLAAAVSLTGTNRGLFPLWVAWLAFSPFIVDATWTLLRRLGRGEPVWRAHRSHHYQRLVLAGWSHRRTVLRAYLLMAACGATAFAAPRMTVRDQWFLIGAWVCIYGFIHYRTRLVERQAGVDAT